MRMPYFILALMSVVAFSQSASAGSSGWTGSGIIQAVQSREFGMDISVSNLGNPMGCSKENWIRLPLTAANYQVIASQIFIYATNKQPIRFWTNQCDSDGTMLVIAADAAS